VQGPGSFPEVFDLRVLFEPVMKLVVEVRSIYVFRIRVQLIIDPVAIPAAFYQRSLLQDSQMPGYGRLGYLQGRLQFADASGSR